MNKPIRSHCFLIFLLLFPILPLFSQSLGKQIARSFNELENDPKLNNAVLSFTVMNAHTGELLFTKNERVGMATASTLKVITAITAYSMLGADHVFQTDLSYSGTIDKAGTLHGDVIVAGEGDPSLGSDRYPQSNAEHLLKRWVKAIQASGIKKIDGRVIADDRLFGGVRIPNGWPWADIGNYYGAGVSSLNWRENTFQVHLKSGTKVGDPVSLLKTNPEVPFLTLVNEVSTGAAGSGDQVYAYSAPYSSVVFLRGTYGKDLNKEIQLSMPDGAFALAHSLKKHLHENGISSQEPMTAYLLTSKGAHLSSPTKIIDTYQSPKLIELVDLFAKKSINLYGEALLKAVAKHENQKTQTEEIAKWEQNYWSIRLGLPAGELKIKDGSGLSPENRVSTLAMVKILADAQKQPWFRYFYENLPHIHGIRMKSGTISDVLGYAGYHTSSDGTPLVFSLIINNHQGSTPSMRQKMFKMLNSLK